MAGSATSQRDSERQEPELRRERLVATLDAVLEQLEPTALARRAAKRIEWRDISALSLAIGRTLRENPVASVVAAGSLLWLALRCHAAFVSHPPRADLVLVPDRENGGPALQSDANVPVWRSTFRQPDRRGHTAKEPQQIPPRGWGEILRRTWRELGEDHISIVAAGVAFYAFLAIFPALGAALSIYGFVADPVEVSKQLVSMGGVLSVEARTLLEQQLSGLTAQSGTALTFAAMASLALALWSASAGIKSMMTALNIAYEEKEKRGFLRYHATALALTLGAILAVLVALALLALLPALIAALPAPGWFAWIASLGRWPILAAAVILGLAVLYRYGPSRNQARWSWVSWGAVAATILWMIASLLFSWYAANFADYNKTYGSVGAIVVLLMWFYLSAYAVLMGAELNAEMERQTAEDTTRAPDKPMGQRGARMADTVAA